LWGIGRLLDVLRSRPTLGGDQLIEPFEVAFGGLSTVLQQ
jgi:hypothetical protein